MPAWLLYDQRGYLGDSRRYINLDESCFPTVKVKGSQFHLYHDQLPSKPMDANKVPYRVPLMNEIAAVPKNGFRVVSTFSGCGGSCLGFKMKGFEVLWANEFVPSAQDTYRANHPEVKLNTNDIRTVKPEMILDEVELLPGEIDVMEGSPPCSSFSTSGKREKKWGDICKYSDGIEQRTDDLFFEFTRLLKGLQPKVFVGENVSGLVRGTAKGYFKMILRAMMECGYEVKSKLLDAQWLGVPQVRQRIIFIGVRNDLVATKKVHPEFPKPLSYRYSVREAIPWIDHHQNGIVMEPEIEPESDISRFAIGDEWDKIHVGTRSKYINMKKARIETPCATITSSGGVRSAAAVVHPMQKRKFSMVELRRICGFPDDFILTGSYTQQWERLGRAVPPVMMSHVAGKVLEVLMRCAD